MSQGSTFQICNPRSRRDWVHTSCVVPLLSVLATLAQITPTFEAHQQPV